jgi:hypothetical protein
VPIAQADYERASTRAHAKHNTIVGIEVTPSATKYAVCNPQRAGSHYTVILPVRAKAMTCGCQAGGWVDYCKHRSVAREYILATGRASTDSVLPNARALPLMSAAGREASARQALAERTGR